MKKKIAVIKSCFYQSILSGNKEGNKKPFNQIQNFYRGNCARNCLSHKGEDRISITHKKLRADKQFLFCKDRTAPFFFIIESC